MIIAYNDATITMTAPSAGDWEAGVDAIITITDPDLNTNPGSAETLSIGNSSSVIPTIKIGSPLTLTGGGVTNPNLQKGDATAKDASTSSGVFVGNSKHGGNVGYALNIYNTTDNSERLRIIHSDAQNYNEAKHTVTWINVTTGHTRADITNLPGTVVLSYDITGPAAQLSSTAIHVYITDSGDNGTTNVAGKLALLTSGNSRSGVLDLDDGTYFVKSPDITASSGFFFGSASNAGTNFVNVNFRILHEVGDILMKTEDYAIAADFCNFDQNNGSLTHNCIYIFDL